MGTASGTPQKMYDYTAQTNRASGDLASYVRTTFARLVATYDAGAVSCGFNIAGLTSGASTIGTQVDQVLRQIWATDHQVRTVGQLLYEAGSNDDSPGARLPPGLFPPTPQTKPVTTTDAEVDAADMREGAALAAAMPGRLDSSRSARLYWQTLAQHVEDPLFAAGYFNALSQVQLQIIPWNSASTKALAAAFASGKLTPQAQRAIAWAIVDRYNNPGEIPTFLFKALAANPQAAANFTRYLLHDREMLRYLVQANGWGDGYPQFREPHSEAPFLRGLLPVFTSAAKTMTPAEVRALSGAIAGNLPELDPADARPIIPQIQQFLATAAPRLVGPPVLPQPGQANEEALQLWAGNHGRTLEGLLVPYQNWLRQIYADDHEAKQMELALFVGVAGAILTAPVGGEGGLAGLAEMGAAGGASGVLGELLKVPEDEPPNMANYLHKSAIVTVITAAYAHGLVGKHGELTLQQLLQDPEAANRLRHVLALVERGQKPSPADMKWAYDLPLKNGGNLGAAIDALGNQF